MVDGWVPTVNNDHVHSRKFSVKSRANKPKPKSSNSVAELAGAVPAAGLVGVGAEANPPSKSSDGDCCDGGGGDGGDGSLDAGWESNAPKSATKPKNISCVSE